MTAKDILRAGVEKALSRAAEKLDLVPGAPIPQPSFEIPKNEAHGDYSTNIALVLAPRLKKRPAELANLIVEAFADQSSFVREVSIAGPGFINFSLKESFWLNQLREILLTGPDFGKSTVGGGKKVQIEFVSANPTGPLHIGHGRGAALGDSLARILAFCGFQVTTEYYINDVGTQMEILGRSVLRRYQELLGRPVEFPENHYQGDYIYDVAREAIERFGDTYRDRPDAEAIPLFTALARESILEGIKKDLKDFSVSFDTWYSERSLVEKGAVEATIAHLQSQGYMYLQDGALWFSSTRFGDEKDRVVIRENGQKTYFASDIAYHQDKFSRGFDQVVDIWGADHHGYVPRIKSVLQALGIDPERLRVLLVQLVALLREGVPISMSTRSGQFVTLRAVLDEVGSDASRYIFLTRRSDSPLDFDLEVAKKQSDENPVYYVQYAHARLCSILRIAAERGIDTTSIHTADLSVLSGAEEMALIKRISHFPDILELSAQFLEPHRIANFLQDLVSIFHRYYHVGKIDGSKRVLTEEEHLTRARLALVDALRITIRNALSLLGVSAPEKM